MTKYYQPSTTHEEQRQHECRQYILQLQRHNWYHTKTRLQFYLGAMYPCIAIGHASHRHEVLYL